MSDATTIDFKKMDGLAPGIVQDARTGEVLMLGFLNSVSYAKTLETGFVTFWSRTPPEAVDERRDQRQPAAHRLGLHGLRQRHTAVPRGCGRRRPRLPRGHGQLLYQATAGREGHAASR